MSSDIGLLRETNMTHHYRDPFFSPGKWKRVTSLVASLWELIWFHKVKWEGKKSSSRHIHVCNLSWKTNNTKSIHYDQLRFKTLLWLFCPVFALCFERVYNALYLKTSDSRTLLWQKLSFKKNCLELQHIYNVYMYNENVWVKNPAVMNTVGFHWLFSSTLYSAQRQLKIEDHHDAVVDFVRWNCCNHMSNCTSQFYVCKGYHFGS